MTTLDPTVQRAVDDAELEAELQRLLQNRPSYARAVPGTEPSIEEGTARAITSTAAEITVYNRESGEPSQVIFDALKARMNQRFPEDHPNPHFAGQRVYTLKPEEAPPIVRGKLACPLWFNEPSPDALELGFGGKLCKKPPYFLTEYDVELHVEKNHARFAMLRQRAKEDRERQEQRDQQAQLTAALMRLSERDEARGLREMPEPEAELEPEPRRGPGRPPKGS